MKFFVKIEETKSEIFTVEANDAKEACEKIRDQHFYGELELKHGVVVKSKYRASSKAPYEQ